MAALSARLTPKELAAQAGRNYFTVVRALEDGTLHGAQRVKGGRWLIRTECAEAWLDGETCHHKRRRAA